MQVSSLVMNIFSLYVNSHGSHSPGRRLFLYFRNWITELPRF